MQDRGLAAYIAELVGTMLLVFAVCTVVTLYVATAANSQSGSDFAVVGLVHGIVLFVLIATLGGVSGGHFNPAVTFAAWVSRRKRRTASACSRRSLRMTLTATKRSRLRWRAL